jgi:pimeloyl-ACP methyl ester carboxylesterase
MGAALVILLPFTGALYQWTATRSFERQHPPPGELIDVGGHRLHIHSQGSGGPAVIIDAGLSAASWECESFAGRIAGFTQVCTYDRAGYGWSDPGPRPRTSQQVVAELRALLQRAQIKPPYILVGHSWGGLNVRLYASQYPNEVVGLVLLDAVNLDLLPETHRAGELPFLYEMLDRTACLGTAPVGVAAYVSLEPKKRRRSPKEGDEVCHDVPDEDHSCDSR